jgi:Replication protein C (RepC)
MQNPKKKQWVSANCEQSFALCEMQHALLDGVFEPTFRGKDAHLRFREVEGSYKWRHPGTGQIFEDAVHLTLLIPYAVNAQAESILLAIIKMSSINGQRIDPDQPMLPSFDPPTGNARIKNTVQTCCTKYELLKASGMDTGKHDYQQLNFYLKQLSHIMVDWENTASGWSGSSWFLSHDKHKDGRLIIRLNWRLAGAVFSEYDYAKIDLNERHTLVKDASKTLHRWLSAHLWAGKSEFIRYETLIKHIWTQEATKKTQQKRVERLRNEILADLASLDRWTVEMKKDGAQITHLKDHK